jgi:hypothetical protein
MGGGGASVVLSGELKRSQVETSLRTKVEKTTQVVEKAKPKNGWGPRLRLGCGPSNLHRYIKHSLPADDDDNESSPGTLLCWPNFLRDTQESIK